MISRVHLFDIIAILLSLTALCSYLNYRYIHLHTTIGVMLIALAISILLLALGDSWLGIRPVAIRLLQHVQFDQALLQWMLGFLLFAGAMHVDISELARQKALVSLLATLGTAASMFIVGALTWLALKALGIPMPWIFCLLFGALISPTDPVAVLAIMKVAGAPKSVETKLAGESLFNDGIGVVLFLTLVAFTTGHQPAGPGAVVGLLLREVVGGAIIGLVAGWVVFQLLKRVDQYQVEVLLTLALAMGGYALAGALHTSAPIAAVVSGMLIGNRGRAAAMSAKTRTHLDDFWELIDEILNAVLFLMVGLVMLTLAFNQRHLLAILLIIPITLFARWCSVFGAILLLSRKQTFRRGLVPILTWGGLRGGLSVAMALSLPPSDARATIIAITYGVVIFSIAIQGTTIKALVHRCLRDA